MRKNKIFKIIMVIILVSVFPVYSVALNFYKANHIILIDNQESSFDNPIMSLGGNTYIALRELCNKLNIGISTKQENNVLKINISTNEPYQIDGETTILNGVIPNEDIALEICETILRGIKGDEVVDKYLPLYIRFNHDTGAWEVTSYEIPKKIEDNSGTSVCEFIPPDALEIAISKETGEVFYIR